MPLFTTSVHSHRHLAECEVNNEHHFFELEIFYEDEADPEKRKEHTTPLYRGTVSYIEVYEDDDDILTLDAYFIEKGEIDRTHRAIYKQVDWNEEEFFTRTQKLHDKIFEEQSLEGYILASEIPT